MGLSPEAMASLAYALAVAGIDNVKDDHSSPITSSARSLSA